MCFGARAYLQPSGQNMQSLPNGSTCAFCYQSSKTEDIEQSPQITAKLPRAYNSASNPLMTCVDSTSHFIGLQDLGNKIKTIKFQTFPTSTGFKSHQLGKSHINPIAGRFGRKSHQYVRITMAQLQKEDASKRPKSQKTLSFNRYDLNLPLVATSRLQSKLYHVSHGAWQPLSTVSQDPTFSRDFKENTGCNAAARRYWLQRAAFDVQNSALLSKNSMVLGHFASTQPPIFCAVSKNKQKATWEYI